MTVMAVLLTVMADAQTLDEELARIGVEVRGRALQPQAVAAPAPVPAAPAATAPPPVPTTAFTPPPIGGGNERLPEGLDQNGFEAALARDFAGTFNFYNQLRPADKAAVFDVYRQDGRVDPLRRETLRLLTQP